MKALYSIIISLLFVSISYPQVPILFYDFENNIDRNTFENIVEQSINPGSGPIVRVGSGIIETGVGNNNAGCGLYSSKWQNITTDPGTAATEYYQFTVNTTGFKGIGINFRFSIPFASGPGNFGVLISSNGTNYKKVGSLSIGQPVSGWGDAGWSFYGYPEANNISSLTIRIYAFKGGNTGSGGFMALDNLTVTADTVISNAGNITLLNESNIYNSYYSGVKGNAIYRKNFVINGPGTTVFLSSPLDILQNIIVSNGATLVCGNFPVWGYGSFNLNNGGTLSIGSPAGISLLPDSSGNICLKGARIYNSGSNYIFNGSSTQITGNGLPTSMNCFSINNNSGVTLTNSFQVIDTLKFLSGNLFLGEKNLVIGDAAVISGSSADSYVVTDGIGSMIYNKVARNTDVKFPIGTPASYNPVILNYTGTIDTFRAAVKSEFDNPPLNSNKVVNRQWTISENNSGGSVASIKLCWVSGNEAPGFNASSQVMVGRFDEAGWNQFPSIVSGIGTISDPYFASVSGITQLSSFCVGNDGALPVELIAFYVESNNTDVTIYWNTATEINCNSFEIERKELSGKLWLKIGSVHANFLSNSPKTYSFNDINLKPGEYIYRLKMIDNDGSFEYSKIVEVEVTTPKNFELSQNYPNPFNPSTKINYNLPFDSKVTLEVYNITGERISQLVNEEKSAGYYSVEFNSTNLSSGIYFYRIIAADKATGNNFSTIKKMILLK